MFRTLALGILMTIAHGKAHAQHHGHHGNPEDLEGYIAKMEDPSRDAWQKPDEVLRALNPSGVVCDIGAGPGYFTLKIARALGEKGHVFAVDVEPRILSALRERIAKANTRNVTPVLALEGDSLLPPKSCDLILIVDTFHHFPDGVAYLRELGRVLKPGGRIANIDFHKRELPVGPPPDHKIARDDFVTLAKRAGFEVAEEPKFLPYQYFLVLKPKRD